MPKFDVVVGNPPYLKGMHLRFLNLAKEISKNYVIFLGPASWIITEKNTFLETKRNIEKNIISIDIYNPFVIFPEVGIGTPLGIFYLNVNKTNDKFKVFDRMINNEYVAKSIQEISKYGNNQNFKSLKTKIGHFIENNNSIADYRGQGGQWYVNLASVIGHLSQDKDNMFANPDFFTLVPRNLKVEQKPRKQSSFGFKTKEEAQNFLNYLKTKFARFCLSIYKIHLNNYYNFVYIPWLDFSQEWTDKKLYAYFNISTEEIKFIEDNISDYY